MISPRPFIAVLAAVLLEACATAPSYDDTWSWDSPYFDEQAVLGQAGLLPSQQETYATSIWTWGGGAIERRREYQLRTQHELWVRRQVELGKMSIQEGQAQIRNYIPKTAS
jgi:hypothetical protein